jgi:hypothetical protein
MSFGQPTNVLVLSQICAANPAVEVAVQSIQRGEILYPEYLCRIWHSLPSPEPPG